MHKLAQLNSQKKIHGQAKYTLPNVISNKTVYFNVFYKPVLPRICTGNKNMMAAMSVGNNADTSNHFGEIEPWGKQPRKIENPAGLGALAITVKPPPVTAPATSI